MGEVDFLLNGHRTRIIESYPFDLDRPVELPHELSKSGGRAQNEFIPEIVLRWQTNVKMRAIQGPGWRQDSIFYVQVGIEDNLALSGIAPGTIVSVEQVSRKEQIDPKPDALYLLQFGNGYRCCRCTVSLGKLILLPRGVRYEGPYEYLYPQEARIVGKARGFAVRLPPVRPIDREVPRSHMLAPLSLPWEQPSLAALFRTKRLRFGLTEQALGPANEILRTGLGAELSCRTIRRYERITGIMPHTSTMLALALFHAARISDVLRLLGLWRNDDNRHSLNAWQTAHTLHDLPLVYLPAATPSPPGVWKSFIEEWGEWPTLLSRAVPNLQALQHRLLRIDQADIFNGLDPLIRPGAIALLEEMDEIPKMQNDPAQTGWDRPLYAIRHKQNTFCGYLVSDGQHVSLVPHPRSSGRRHSFLRNQVTIVGRLVGLASPLN
jgi:hypothetical protein